MAELAFAPRRFHHHKWRKMICSIKIGAFRQPGVAIPDSTTGDTAALTVRSIIFILIGRLRSRQLQSILQTLV